MPAIAIGVVMAVMAVASTVYSGVQARKQAEAQEEQQRINNEVTMQSAVAQMGDLDAATKDTNEDASEEGLKTQADYIRNVSQVNLMAGASGTYGGSVDSMLRDLKTTRGRNMSAIVKNRDTQLGEIQKQAEQIRYGARANMDTRMFNKPSGFGIGLSAVASGVSAYGSGYGMGKGMAGAAPASSGGGGTGAIKAGG